MADFYINLGLLWNNSPHCQNKDIVCIVSDLAELFLKNNIFSWNLSFTKFLHDLKPKMKPSDPKKFPNCKN